MVLEEQKRIGLNSIESINSYTAGIKSEVLLILIRVKIRFLSVKANTLTDCMETAR